MFFDTYYYRNPIAAILLLAATALPAVAGGDDLYRPFDLDKIPMDDNWEKAYETEDFLPLPCGLKFLYDGMDIKTGENRKTIESSFSLIDKKTGKKRTKVFKGDYSFTFLGCSNDSRYIFLKKYGDEGSILFLDANTLNEAAILPFKKDFSSALQIFSPDGKKLAWYAEEKIKLDEGWEVKTYPLLKEFSETAHNIKWSTDSTTVYFLLNDDPQKLVVYEVETGKRKTIIIDYPSPDFYGLDLKIHPETKKAYIHAGFYSGGELITMNDLFVLNPREIPTGRKAVHSKPEKIGDIYSSFDLGPDDTIIFNIYPYTDWVSFFPYEYSGIFISDISGKSIRRLTSTGRFYDPVYDSINGILSFTSMVVDAKEMKSHFSTVVYKRKSNATTK